MYSHSSNQKHIIHFLRRNIGSEREFSLLDVGCGIGRLGYELKKVFKKIIIDGVDAFSANVDTCAELKIGDDFVYRNVLHKEVGAGFFRGPLKYDLLLLADTLVYLDRAESTKILYSIAGKAIVTFPFDYEEGHNEFPGNPFTVVKGRWEHMDLVGFWRRCLFRGNVEGVYLI